jgi:hypothetical protein
LITRSKVWNYLKSGWITWLLILLLAVFIALNPALPVLAETPAWMPLEGEHEIGRRQYPERYPAALLLPDLRTLPPSAISLVVEQSNGRKSLRFSNAVWNAGPGVLELHGELDPDDEIIHVVQIVSREDGTLLERPAGEFEYHREHQHVHWDAFAQYQIWSAQQDGNLVEMLASSDKVGYCLRDIKPYVPPADTEEQLHLVGKSPLAPSQPGFTSCYWRRQGMSVGWYDIYYSYTSGQSLDISQLADGIYALLSTADPTQILRESDESNNSAVIYFSLQDEQITPLDELNGRN